MGGIVVTAGAAGSRIGTRSVLFTDLAESTELRVRLGEAAADELRRVHDALLSAAIRDNGGTVVKGLGDGLMATFESAADAVAGAIAVEQAAQRHSSNRPEQSFNVRVGVSIGDVATEDHDVFGVPVVEAARLCSSAAAGEILVADLVRALARGRGEFRFEPMGALALKGLPEPVEASRVLWQPLLDAATGGGHPIPPALLGAATPYVGRDDLLSRLSLAWGTARGGACRTTLLAGEPGVGKTRTSAELARAAFSEGALVLYGRCDEDLAVPYQPFVEALTFYTLHAEAPVLGRLPGELTRLVPDLGVPDLPPAVHSDPASEEYRLYEATASWLIEVARAAPAGLVLVLDDIHWATKPTLHLLQHVVREASDEHAPIFVIGTYRDTDIDRTHPLSSALGDLRRLPGVDRIAVDNLTGDEVIEFLTAAAGHELDEATTRLAHVMYDETEGNPFFIGEVIRHLIETGGVRRDGDRWSVADPDHVTVPEGVRDVVGRRLSRLTDAANEVLSVAAVIGREFDAEPLMAVVDLGEDAALDALDLAVRARLVEETGVDQYRFAHALVRTTLYDELSATRRRRLHRRVADALEKLRPNDVRALAYHCTQAGPDGGDTSRALRYTIAVAEQSLAARAFGDAETDFRAALDLLEDADVTTSRDHVAVLCGLGEAQRDQGDPAFRETLLDAARQAEALGDTALLTRAVLANTRGFASVIGGVDEQRLHYIERAADLLPPEASAERARVLGLLASELTFSGGHEQRLRLADEAEAMARSTGDLALLGDVLTMTGYAAITGPNWARLVDRTAEATRLADRTGDPTRRVVARVFSSAALLTAGRVAESVREVEDMVAISADAPPLQRWEAESNVVRVQALRGDLDEADAQNNRNLERARELGQPDGEQWWAATMLGLLWLRGYGGSVPDAAGEFAAQYPLLPIWRCAQVWVLAEAGRHDDARAIIREHGLAEVDLLVDPRPFVPTAQLALAAWMLGDGDLGRRCVEDLAPYRQCWAHYYLLVFGPVSWPLGCARAATGDLDGAVADLDDAVEQMSALDHRGHLPMLMLHFAMVLRTRNAERDAARADDLLERARAMALEVGAHGVVDRVDALRAG